MRVTRNILFRTYIDDITRQYRSIFKTQRQLSTGKKLSTPSDDPARVGNLLDSKSLLTRLGQYERNIDSGLSYLGIAENALSGSNDILTRLKELAVLNATDTANPEMTKAAATEAESLLQSLVTLADTSFEGGFIFSGNKVDTPPFDSTGHYSGDSGERVININTRSSMTLGLNGGKVFKGTGGGVDIFDVVNGLITALNGNDRQAISSSISALDTASSQISRAISEIGGRTLRLKSARDAISEFGVDIRIGISNTEDADIPRVISDLQLGNVALEAAMNSSARILRQSILDFL